MLTRLHVQALNWAKPVKQALHIPRVGIILKVACSVLNMSFNSMNSCSSGPAAQLEAGMAARCLQAPAARLTAEDGAIWLVLVAHC